MEDLGGGSGRGGDEAREMDKVDSALVNYYDPKLILYAN